MKRILILALVAIFAVFNCSKPKEKLSILTGGQDGNYYKAAQELNEVLKKGFFELDIKESTGSIRNIGQLGSGAVNLALAQYDVIILNALYLDEESKKLVNNCHVVAPMAYEVIHILTHKNSGINTLDDLKGKKVVVGQERSGTWVSAYLIMKAVHDINITKDSNMIHLPDKDAIAKLLAGEVDAMFLTSMEGVPLLKDIPASEESKIKLVSVGSNYQIPQLIQNFYFVKQLSANTYPWQKEDAFTYATPSYLLANKSFSREKVKKIAELVYKNADTLKKKSSL
ncbi:MAG: TAXI family TRAP transporter solute-binding subunit, partial [Leptospiraceae bacterium]|nr:TAXI family TRAP transporter solute-binding subunit [Leptospiraceae bacterium]